MYYFVAPIILDVRSTSTSLQVFWSYPITAESKTKVFDISASYQGSSSSPSVVIRTMDTSIRNYTITGLEESSKYVVTVIAEFSSISNETRSSIAYTVSSGELIIYNYVTHNYYVHNYII